MGEGGMNDVYLYTATILEVLFSKMLISECDKPTTTIALYCGEKSPRGKRRSAYYKESFDLKKGAK